MHPRIALANPFFWGYAIAFAILLLLAGILLFWFERKRRREEERQVYWSWVLLVSTTLIGMLLGPEAIALLVISAALFACHVFARATGLFTDWVFPALVSLAIIGVNLAALWKSGYEFFLTTPIYAVALLCLVPVFRNRPEGMLQRVALSVIAFVYFGYFLAHLTLLVARLPNDLVCRCVPFVVYGVATADLVGWAVNRWVGRRPLLSRISPDQTWEGAFASLVWAALWSFTLGWWTFPATDWTWFALVASTLLLGPVGLLGDLALRYVERDLGVTAEHVGDFAPSVALEHVHRLLFVAPLFFRLSHAFIPEDVL